MKCINADGYYLTQHKEYEAIKIINYDRVIVVNDTNRECEYPLSIFDKESE